MVATLKKEFRMDSSLCTEHRSKVGLVGCTILCVPCMLWGCRSRKLVQKKQNLQTENL